jgi:uncharacterized protein YeeX (DUF496 family)
LKSYEKDRKKYEDSIVEIQKIKESKENLEKEVQVLTKRVFSFHNIFRLLLLLLLKIDKESSLRFTQETSLRTQQDYIKKLEAKLIVNAEGSGIAEKITKLINKVQQLKVFGFLLIYYEL